MSTFSLLKGMLASVFGLLMIALTILMMPLALVRMAFRAATHSIDVFMDWLDR